MNISLSQRQRLANIFPAISEICEDNNRLLSNRKSNHKKGPQSFSILSNHFQTFPSHFYPSLIHSLSNFHSEL